MLHCIDEFVPSHLHSVEQFHNCFCVVFFLMNLSFYPTVITSIIKCASRNLAEKAKSRLTFRRLKQEVSQTLSASDFFVPWLILFFRSSTNSLSYKSLGAFDDSQQDIRIVSSGFA